MSQPVTPLTGPLDATVRPPGSKSITNRALLCAALAPGTSTLTGALFADDTHAMMGALTALGARVSVSGGMVQVTGGSLSAGTVDARQSGTTSRFVLPVAALLPGRTVVDGTPQLRARPFGPVLDALRQAGAVVESSGFPSAAAAGSTSGFLPAAAGSTSGFLPAAAGSTSGFLPAAVTGPAAGGEVAVSGHISSQFLSGLLMAGPLMRDGLRVILTSPLVSVPYVRMTEAVMAAFGVTVSDLSVEPGSYVPAHYAVEPDASAASYFLGAAAVGGGRITISGLGSGSLQGDVAFADVLARMGATVTRDASSMTVTSTGRLRGVDVDMADISDTAQTLAAVAVFADSPTRVRGIGFIRGKETDRVGAVVTELRRAGIDAIEDEDGFTIHPGTPRPTAFETYEDHRMAMSLALLGLRAPGIEIKDPGCVAKTYPDFFTDLERLRN
ncbi:3-phosphoshikimate 1-carboxyvinyltransferase [Actinoplanes sp. RD1]|uniref:3-phosphoshikimate 1-carboxyvinyltransferase n=1 Tax=Actinoplanes sp. RD1 TaxID=3064538 RepID=UPI0027425F41|nr:3-phosphoshikimate 1-carboxyvinyltransferase [Actinoplanes sp. RD1]